MRQLCHIAEVANKLSKPPVCSLCAASTIHPHAPSAPSVLPRTRRGTALNVLRHCPISVLLTRGRSPPPHLPLPVPTRVGPEPRYEDYRLGTVVCRPYQATSRSLGPGADNPPGSSDLFPAPPLAPGPAPPTASRAAVPGVSLRAPDHARRVRRRALGPGRQPGRELCGPAGPSR